MNPSSETQKPQQERKPYVKPQLERVRLVLEEAVLGTGCKTTTSAGPENPCGALDGACLILGS